MSWTKKLITVILLFIITIILLELSSLLILKLKKTGLSAVQKEFVFKKVTPIGEFTPDNDYVLPIRENANFQWDSNEFSVKVKTNSFGLREDFEIQLSEMETIFFGDSFTFGHGVEGHERYSYIYKVHLPLEKQKKVVSLSYKNGFQPEHYEFYFRNNENLRPRKVVVGLYLGNDLDSDLAETKYEHLTNQLTLPYRRIFSEGQMGNSLSAFRFPLNRLSESSNFLELFLKVIGKTPFRSYLFKDGFEGPNSVNQKYLEMGEINLINNRAMQSLKRLRTIVNSRGGKLVVVLIPQNYFFGNINPHINAELKGELESLRKGRNILSETISACHALELDCLDTRPYLDSGSYFKTDAHWNSVGHSRVGAALFDHMR
jgi:hypothetical protein